MKNKELIEILQSLDPEKSILLVKWRTGYWIDKIEDNTFISLHI